MGTMNRSNKRGKRASQNVRGPKNNAKEAIQKRTIPKVTKIFRSAELGGQMFRRTALRKIEADEIEKSLSITDRVARQAYLSPRVRLEAIPFQAAVGMTVDIFMMVKVQIQVGISDTVFIKHLGPYRYQYFRYKRGRDGCS